MLSTIVVENTTVDSAGEGATSDTQSITVPGKRNVGIIVIHCERGAGAAITSATYDGDALSLAKRSSYYDSTFTEIWYITNPSRGTNTLTLNWSGGAGDNNRYAVIVVSGIDMVDPIQDTDEQTGSGSSYSKSLTVEDGGLVVHGFSHTGTSSGNPGAGETLLFERNSNDSCGAAYEDDCTATSQTVSYNGFDPSDSAFSAAMVSFKPATLKGGAFLLNLV